MENIGLIGCGNMGEALLKGVREKETSVGIYFFEPDANKAETISRQYSVKSLKSAIEVVQSSKYILLCVKPGIIATVLNEVKNAEISDKVFISIAAGISIKNMEETVAKVINIVRVMPNTPSLVGKGVSAITRNKHVSDGDYENIQKIFATVGEVVELDETLFDAVTGLSGSGPAYVYTFIQALIQGGIYQGLSSETAKTLAVETVIGAAELVKASPEHIGSLVDKVTSPGGTTIRGLAALEKNGFKTAVIDAVSAATNRSKELGK